MVTDPVEHRTHADRLVVDVPGMDQSVETTARSGDRSSTITGSEQLFQIANLLGRYLVGRLACGPL